MTGNADADVLVDTTWVAEHIDDPKVCLIEAAYDSENYLPGHTPDALPWTWKEDFQHPLRKDVPDEAGWESLLAGVGISKPTTVVVYVAPVNITPPTPFGF
jgi:thiosulfate/3-mercaptopyruvate sulfurtransferase